MCVPDGGGRNREPGAAENPKRLERNSGLQYGRILPTSRLIATLFVSAASSNSFRAGLPCPPRQSPILLRPFCDQQSSPKGSRPLVHAAALHCILDEKGQKDMEKCQPLRGNSRSPKWPTTDGPSFIWKTPARLPCFAVRLELLGSGTVADVCGQPTAHGYSTADGCPYGIDDVQPARRLR